MIIWPSHGLAAPRPNGFHPDQVTEDQPDGSLIVRFHASGWMEMCWHLYQWGDAVEVLEPEALREMVEGFRRSDFYPVSFASGITSRKPNAPIERPQKLPAASSLADFPTRATSAALAGYLRHRAHQKTFTNHDVRDHCGNGGYSLKCRRGGAGPDFVDYAASIWFEPGAAHRDCRRST